MAWMTDAPNWAKKMTKKTIKLKELSDLYVNVFFVYNERNSRNCQKNAQILPESLVDGSKPADIRGRSEEDCVKDGKAKHGATAPLDKQRKTASHVDKVQQGMD